MKAFLSDFVSQAWTFLGMFVAWIVLTGTAKVIVGYAIIATVLIWALTFPLRSEFPLKPEKKKEEKEEKEEEEIAE